MNDEIQITKTTYLCAWLWEGESIPVAMFEVSSPYMFRNQGVVSAGVVRDGHKVIVFSDYIHGHGMLKKDEMRLVAQSYLDGDYNTTEIDFRH